MCVDLVIKSSEGLLLVLRDIEPYRGVWHFPGGMVHKDKSIGEAVKRIAKEEIGLDIKVNGLLDYMKFFNEPMENFNRHTVSLALSTTVVGDQLKADFQSKELRYFTSLPDKIYPGQEKHIKNNLLAKSKFK